MREVFYGNKGRIKGIILGTIIGLVLLAALVVFGLFRVQEVVIIGNDIYKAEEIRSAIMQDGLCKNTLYLLWKYQDDSRVRESLPFLSSLEVEMISPYKVQIKVYEKPRVGYFLKGSDYIYFDRDGMVIDITKEVYEGVPQITGQAIGKAQRYEKLPIEKENEFKATVETARYLHQNGLTAREIKYAEDGSITVSFGKVKAKLGDSKYLEDKMQTLASIYQGLTGEEGIIHMENYHPTTRQTVTLKLGEVEEEIVIAGAAKNEEAETDENSEVVAEVDTNDEETTEVAVPTYQESDGTFSTDAEGNSYYTDAAGNITYNIEQYNYADENGEIVTDGYGYIDPYTGGYIIK